MDLALDPSTHDLLITSEGNLRLTQTTPEAAAQRIGIRLALFLGEWFLDQTAGVPYFQNILVRVPDDSVLRAIFRSQIEADPFVVAVSRIVLALDRATRALTLEFDAQLIEGSELTISISELLSDGTVVIGSFVVVVNGVPLVVS